MSVCTYRHVYTHLCTHVCPCMHVCVCMCACRYIYAHVHVQASSRQEQAASRVSPGSRQQGQAEAGRKGTGRAGCLLTR